MSQSFDSLPQLPYTENTPIFFVGGNHEGFEGFSGLFIPLNVLKPTITLDWTKHRTELKYAVYSLDTELSTHQRMIYKWQGNMSITEAQTFLSPDGDNKDNAL